MVREWRRGVKLGWFNQNDLKIDQGHMLSLLRQNGLVCRVEEEKSNRQKY